MYKDNFEYTTVPEAAAVIGVSSYSNLYRWIDDNILTAHRFYIAMQSKEERKKRRELRQKGTDQKKTTDEGIPYIVLLNRSEVMQVAEDYKNCGRSRAGLKRIYDERRENQQKEQQ